MNWICGDAGNCTDLANGSVGHDDHPPRRYSWPWPASPENLIAANVSTTTCVLEAAVRPRAPHVVLLLQEQRLDPEANYNSALSPNR